ncbi:MAG: NERD domain-containing protein [Clostridia bacterium]|nr:NERD domain-containing protein [Clostridia bacterium]
MIFRKFFHKIKIIILRKFGRSLPSTSQAKDYGNLGENNFTALIKKELPQCKVKKNVVISTVDGNAEIDCLVLYKNKVFAVEVKNWKGMITERKNAFVQSKTDRWTGEVHSKKLKSPFKQINRSIFLLRKQIPIQAWVNAVVFFDSADSVDAESDIAWFCNIEKLATYIIHSGEESSNAEMFFNRCICADTLYSLKKGRTMQGVIMGESLKFKTSQGEISRKDIARIKVSHHTSYDDLKIELTDGSYRRIKQENLKLRVWNNGKYKKYALCKLDLIDLGRGK